MSVDVVTFGCRLNGVESDIIRREAENAGLHRHRYRQHLRRHQRGRASGAPDRAPPAPRAAGARIVVTGCAAQTQTQMFAAMPEVDRIIGNAHKMAGETWRAARDALDVPLANERIDVSDIMAIREMSPHLAEGYQERTRAFIQVQTGCDHRCTFCIIPFGRGNSRSVPMGAVVEHVQAAVTRGCAEVVLTGVDLTSYGADLPGAPPLGRLVATSCAMRRSCSACASPRSIRLRRIPN